MVYGIEFEFLSPSRIYLGFAHTKGIIHEEDGDKKYNEFVIGFLFFFIEITTRERF